MLTNQGLRSAIFYSILSSFDFWGGERKGWVGDQRHQLCPHPHVKPRSTCFRVLKKAVRKTRKNIEGKVEEISSYSIGSSAMQV